MIPFSILSGKLNTADNAVIEIRVLDLAPDYLTFRLPKNYFGVHGRVVNVELFFYDKESNIYKEVYITTPIITEISKEDYYDKYSLLHSSKEAVRLSEEYLHYIECKLDMEDAELAHEYLDYPLMEDNCFCESYTSQLAFFAESVKQDIVIDTWKLFDEKLELGIAIETEEELEKYLCKPIDLYVKSRFDEAFMDFHPLKDMRYKSIFIGNSYCYNLIPSLHNIISAILKAKSENLSVYIVLPPIPQVKLDFAKEYIDALNDYELKWLANDFGTLTYLDNRGMPGVLLNKSRRDTRGKYLNNNLVNITHSSSACFGPFFQTNTGTFCPLYAAVERKDRGLFSQVEKCEVFCKANHFLYPKHLNMVGKYNSLFGFNKDFLCNAEYVFKLKDGGIERMVINL